MQQITITIGAQLGEAGELATRLFNPTEGVWADCYCCSDGTHCCRRGCCGANFAPVKAMYSTMRVMVDDDGHVLSIESVSGECQQLATALPEPDNPRFDVVTVGQ